MLLKIKNGAFFLALVTFFISVSVLLIEINYIVYLAFINIFKITGDKSLVFFIGLVVLSALFMLMLLIERYYSSKIIRFLYIVSASWMGIVVYLFISSLIYIIVNIFIYIPKGFGILFFLIAGSISLLGFIHGRRVVVKNIEISLPNINEEWKGKRIVYMSDLHLGPIRGSNFASKITRISNSLEPDLVFIGGDLYDGAYKPDPFIIAEPLKNLSSSLGVFFITGNHEEFGDPSIFINAVSNLGIQVLDNRMIEISGLQIVGVDYLKAAKKKNFKNILENMNIDKKKPSILLKHEPNDLRVSFDAGISFQLSGHTHHGQQWPFNYLTYFVYKGFSYGLKKYKSMLVYVSSGAGGWGPSLRVGSRSEIVCIKII